MGAQRLVTPALTTVGGVQSSQKLVAPGPTALWLQFPEVRVRGEFKAGNAIKDAGAAQAETPLRVGLLECCSHGSCGGPCLHCCPTRSRGSGEPVWSLAWLNSWGLCCQGQGVGLGCKRTGQGFRKRGACWEVWDDWSSLAAGFCVSPEQDPLGYPAPTAQESLCEAELTTCQRDTHQPG